MDAVNVRPKSRGRQVTEGILWAILGLILFAALGGACLGAVALFSDPAGKIRITEPGDGTVTSTPEIVIRGTSSPDWAGVYRVLGGGRRQTLPVDADGNWHYRATLQEGENSFRFHLDSHYGQSDTVTVIYKPAR